MRRVAAAEVLVVDPESDMVVFLGGARGCTTDEGNAQGRGECRTREWAWHGNQCRVGAHVKTFAFWRENFCLWVGLYEK